MKFLLYGAVPDAAFDALGGLVAAGGRWDLVDVRTPCLVAETAHEVAAIVRAALPALRAQVDWDGWGRLVVDGLLLDLELGRRLRTSGVTTVDSDWLVLVVPDTAAAYGMRCVHDGEAGAALMWRAGDTSRPPLPAAGDVAGLLDPATLPAVRRIVLRHQGWLAGSAPAALSVVAGSALHAALAATGERLHEVLAAAIPGAGAPALAVVRQVIDAASDLLSDTVPADGERRVLWSGTGW
jgi:hypothetical protein